MLISSREAHEILEFIKSQLSVCVVSGCSDYFSLLKHIPQTIKLRTTYNLIYDFIESHARNTFDAVPGVKILDHNGLFLLLVRDKLVLRFKKLNNEKMPSNIPTIQATYYMNQELELPNYPHHTMLIVGYELDHLKTRLQEITITCPNGNSNLWSFNIDGTQGAEIVELPISVSSEPDIPIRLISTKKEGGIRKTSNE